MRFSFLFLIMLIAPLSAMAAEETAPFTYSPPACEFAITFPASPYTSRRCDSEDKSRCYDLISYTKVYDMASTVNFRTTCNPIDETIYSHYSAEVMEATLRAMTNRSVVKTFDTSFRTEDGYKQAGLVGEGKSGAMPTVYIAQIWIGHGSAFSVEAEMIGEAHEDADKLLSDVLRSVHYLTDEERKAKLPGAEKASEENKKQEPPKEEKPPEKEQKEENGK